MFSKSALQYQALPLPDRVDLSDAEMSKAASAFYDRMKKRHSVRAFSDRPVDRHVIEDCVRAAGTAPSGANHQP